MVFDDVVAEFPRLAARLRPCCEILANMTSTSRWADSVRCCWFAEPGDSSAAPVLFDKVRAARARSIGISRAASAAS